MNKPHLFIKLVLLVALVGCALADQTGAQQQQPDSRELYAAAKTHHAAGEYRKALDVIAGLLKNDPDYAPALYLKYKALLGIFAGMPSLRPDEAKSPEVRRERKIVQGKLLQEAAESLERYLQLRPEEQGAAALRRQLASMLVYAEPASRPESEWTFSTQLDVTEKARIIRRPEPRYPEAARALQINGRVGLIATLASDGSVKNIFIFQSPNYLLDEAAIEAARKILFEPAVKDGRQVSVAVSVFYDFNLY
jgi:TonB family protein